MSVILDFDSEKIGEVFFGSSPSARGAGMTTVPVPHFLLILSVIFPTLGRSLLS